MAATFLSDSGIGFEKVARMMFHTQFSLSPKLGRALMLGASLGTTLLAGSAVAADLPQTVARVSLCDLGANAATLYGDDALENMDVRLAENTARCESQSMIVLGSVAGRTYVYWQAQLELDPIEGISHGSYQLVGQVGEIGTDGTLTMVYRIGRERPTGYIDAELTERDGDAYIAIGRDNPVVLFRGEQAMVPVSTDFFRVDEAIVQASLPESYVVEKPDAEGSYGGTFNPETLSIDIPVALASEVFPRQFAVSRYDREMTLNFPLQMDGSELVLGEGEIFEEQENPSSGLGDTPRTLIIPNDVIMCDQHVSITNQGPAGVMVREAPSETAAIIATLPGGIDIGSSTFAPGAEADIIGVSNGWFLIENAYRSTEWYPSAKHFVEARGTGSDFVRTVYTGRGWVHGSHIAAPVRPWGTTGSASGIEPAVECAFGPKQQSEQSASPTR